VKHTFDGDLRGLIAQELREPREVIGVAVGHDDRVDRDRRREHGTQVVAQMSLLSTIDEQQLA